MRFKFFLFCCALFLPGALHGSQQAVWAQEADTVYALPPVKVTAFRMPVALALSPARISIVSDSTITAAASPNLATLLERIGGMFVRQQGTGLATLTLRGASSSQTLILVDGIPFSDPQLGVVDLSLLPTGTLAEVQVLHGSGSAMYGSQGIGGVINLKTRQTSDPYFLEIAGTTGPYGERRGNLAAGFNRNKINGLLSVSRSSITGDFPFWNASLFPPRESRREGADRDNLSVFGKLKLNHRTASTSLSGWFNDVERGLPGTATTTPRGERQWDQNHRFQLQHLAHTRIGLVSMAAAMQFNQLRYLNPQITLDQISKTNATTVEVEWSHLPLSVETTTGVAGTLYHAQHPNLLEDAREYQLGWFANSHITTNRVGLIPALRFDAILPATGRRLVAVSPSVGLNIHPFAQHPTRLKLNAGRVFRSPTFNDRFWQPGGNPNLRPEHGWHFDTGLLFTHQHLTLETTAFLHRIKDQITWQPGADNPDIWQPANIGLTRSAGMEASASYTLQFSSTSQLSTSFFYTLVDARDVSDASSPAYKQPLRYTPRHLLKSTVGFNHTTRPLVWHLDVLSRFVGSRHVASDGSQMLDPYFAMDLQVRATWQTSVARFTAGVFFENLTNRSYEVIKGYPVPPRTIRLQFLMRLAGEE